MEFKKGDFVIRSSKGRFSGVVFGETYEVVGVDEGFITLKGFDRRVSFQGGNFILHPANGSPLLEALK